MENITNTKPKKKNTKLRLFVFFVLAAFTYILSVGPVLSLGERVHCYGTPSYRFLRAFYCPVFMVAKSSDVGARLYDSYARMWCRFVLPPGYPGTEVPAMAAFQFHPTPETQIEFNMQERLTEFYGLVFSIVIACWAVGVTLFIAHLWRSRQEI